MNKDKNKSYRNTFTVERIERKVENDKKELSKDVALLGASALAVGIGALGTVLMGDSLIKMFQSGDPLTLSSFILVNFKGAVLSLSLSTFLVGAIGAVKKMQDTISSFKNLNYDTAMLKDVKEEEKGRTK